MTALTNHRLPWNAAIDPKARKKCRQDSQERAAPRSTPARHTPFCTALAPFRS